MIYMGILTCRKGGIHKECTHSYADVNKTYLWYCVQYVNSNFTENVEIYTNNTIICIKSIQDHF